MPTSLLRHWTLTTAVVMQLRTPYKYSVPTASLKVEGLA